MLSTGWQKWIKIISHIKLSTLTVPIPSNALVTMPKKTGISFQSTHRKLLLSENPESESKTTIYTMNESSLNIDLLL